MCGIFAYVGSNECSEMIYTGLKRLEYRGYDSAGIAVLNNSISVCKTKGVVSGLELDIPSLKGTLGIGHTRWATHGKPSVHNAHPHLSADKSIAIVHNGIIENYHQLKEALIQNGYSFTSETDSEVLAHLVHQHVQTSSSLQTAVLNALKLVQGTYGVAVISSKYPSTLVVARKGSPLVIGISKGEYFVSSDPSALIEHTRNVSYLEDNQVVTLTPDNYTITNISTAKEEENSIQKIDWELSTLEKGGYDSFMLKEIYEQAQAVRNALRGRMQKLIKKGSLNIGIDSIAQCKRIMIVACGTSWHAGLVAKQYFDKLTELPVEVDYASEFRYRNPRVDEHDLVIAISQSGETADTLEAVKLAKQKGAITLGVVNVVGSTIAREVHGGKYLHAGPEIGVASTKAFSTQLIVLLLLALHIGVQRGTVSKKTLLDIAHACESLPDDVEKVLESHKNVKTISSHFLKATNALYLGRGLHFPVALEGALKLKEISYIHAEGLPAAEIKHGPIALIDHHMPVVVLAPYDELFEKLLSTIQEVKARGGEIIALTTQKNASLAELVHHTIIVPQVHPLLQPIISNIPLQLLSYELAIARGCNVDRPRNLAKSVTVE